MTRFNTANLWQAIIAGLFFCLTAAGQTQTDLSIPPRSGAFGTYVAALPNGNFVVTDPLYDAPGPIADVGAVYLYDGATKTVISSLTGSQANDQVGNFEIQILSNGNYVVMSPDWNNGTSLRAGAATLCSMTTGCSGTVSAMNSLVGTNQDDRVSVGGITPLPSGKYVVNSYEWNGKRGAVNFCLAAGCTGNVATTNSLHGTSVDDQVGFYQIAVLPNGNYVVMSMFWGFNFQYGAVTLCDGSAGCVNMAVSPANSMTGTDFFEIIGSQGITVLTGGDFVVGSANWNDQRGAATRCSQTTGCPPNINSTNSLVGTEGGGTPSSVARGGIIALTDGNYVVSSSSWNNSRGAVTWCSANAACTGAVSATNSLVGTAANNQVGSGGISVLPGGKYVVSSPNWDNSATATIDVGAATFCGAAGVCNGTTVSTTNSLVGSTTSDFVSGEVFGGRIMVLTDGDYVVNSFNWDKAGIVNAGASTFCNGATGCVNMTVSAMNSLTGTSLDDQVGNGATFLTNGNYVVRSPMWDGAFQNVGAATWCSGSGDCAGTVVSATNSLVGSQANDNVGNAGTSVGVLPNGNYVVRSTNWDNGAIVNAGALTYGNGASGTFGTINSMNSVLGMTANGGAIMDGSFDAANNRLIVGRPAENTVTVFAFSPTAASVTVSGRVTAAKRGVARARVTLTGANGEARTVLTNSFGYYRMEEVTAGETYILNASAKQHSFAPQVITITEDLTEMNFASQMNNYLQMLR